MPFRLAGREQTVDVGCALAGANAFGRRRDLLAKQRGLAEMRDVDRDEEMRAVIGHAEVAVERTHLRAGGALRQQPAHHVDHERQSEALGAARRQQHAGDRFRRIGRRRAGVGDGPGRRDYRLGFLGHADLAHRRFARRHVEHDRDVAGRRQRDGERVVADDALGAARRRHQRPRIAHGDADAVGLRRLLRVASGRAEMKTVPHRHDTGTEGVALVDGDRHCLAPGEMPERMTGVEHDGAVALRHDRAALLA